SRMRSRHVDRPGYIGLQQKIDCVTVVIGMNPGQYLLAITNNTAKTERKRQAQALEHTALRAKYNASPQPEQPFTDSCQRLSSVFPVGTQTRGKILSGTVLLVQRVRIHPGKTAVVTDGRTAEHCTEALTGTAGPGDQIVSQINTAVAQCLFAGSTPAAVGNALT